MQCIEVACTSLCMRTRHLDPAPSHEQASAPPHMHLHNPTRMRMPSTQAMLAESKGRQEGLLVQLGDAFSAGDLDAAAEVTTKLRYVVRIQEAILEKL
jgi:hypothetical protein